MAQQARSIPRLTGITCALAAIAAVFAVTPSPADAAEKSKLLTEVHFDPGSIALSPGARQKVEKAIAAIKEGNPGRIQIIGFTDSIGDKGINRKIAKDRAQSVADLLVESGVTAPLVVEGKGEDGAPYKTADGVSEPLNRCVGIIAVGSAGDEPVEPML